MVPLVAQEHLVVPEVLDTQVLQVRLVPVERLGRKVPQDLLVHQGFLGNLGLMGNRGNPEHQATLGQLALQGQLVQQDCLVPLGPQGLMVYLVGQETVVRQVLRASRELLVLVARLDSLVEQVYLETPVALVPLVERVYQVLLDLLVAQVHPGLVEALGLLDRWELLDLMDHKEWLVIRGLAEPQGLWVALGHQD